MRKQNRALAATIGGGLLSAALVVPSWPAPAISAPAASSPGYHAQQLLVGFRPGTSDAEKAKALGKVSGHEKKRIGGVVLATVPKGQELQSASRLHDDPSVRYAEPDWVGELAATPDDPSFDQQWPLANTGQVVGGSTGTPGEDIGARAAWDLTTGDPSVVVGVVDTGVDYDHPDLAANIWNNPGTVNGCGAGTHGYNALNDSCDPQDDDTAYGGHGTHVAGIIGAVGNNGVGVAGVSWHPTVLPVKTVDSSGNGTTSALLSGLDWLLRAKQAGVNIQVVNDSQTWKGTAYSQALRDEVALLGSNGILFVSAGGNTSEDNDNPTLRRYPCGYVTPTSLCAAATTSTGSLASYANRGSTTVDLGAPGDKVYSTLRGGTYGLVSGSSMAAAEVSGAAALVLAQQPGLTTPELKQALLVGARSKPSLAGLVRTGARLDVCGALTGCATTTAGPATGTLGTTSVGGSVDTMSADRKRVNRVTLAVQGEVSKLSAYLAPTAVSGTQLLTGVVYADAAGAPGALVARTDELAFSSTQAAGWYDLTLPAPVSLAPGTYWIGLASGGTGGVTGFRWTSVSGSRAWNTASYAAGPTDPFGTATVDAEQMSLYATYTYTAPAPPAPPPFAVTPPVTTATGAGAPAPTQGLAVTTTGGVWANGPVTLGYQWRRCSSAGTSCTSIGGATGTSYTPVAADVGSTLQAVVTATSSAGTTSSASPPSYAVVAGSTPSNGLGITTVGGSTDRFAANRKSAITIDVSTAGHLTRLNVYLQRTNTSGSQSLVGVLYRDSAGRPGALVAKTAVRTFSSSQAAGWNQLVFSTPVSVTAGRYWIGVHAGRSNAVAGFRWTSRSGARAFNNDTYDDGPANPFGTASVDSELMSIYATWTT